MEVKYNKKKQTLIQLLLDKFNSTQQSLSDKPSKHHQGPYLNCWSRIIR